MITLDEAKLQLNIPAPNTTHDVELQAFVDGAIRAVELHTGELATVRTVTGERHVTCYTARLRLHHKPVQSVTTIARVDASLTWDVADLDLDADSGVVRVISGPLLSGLIAATYEAGYVNAPDNYNLAARIIVQHLWQTQRGAMGGRLARSGMDDSLDNLVNFGRGYAIPNAALELLGEPMPVVA